jgi:hypothetical protein
MRVLSSAYLTIKANRECDRGDFDCFSESGTNFPYLRRFALGKKCSATALLKSLIFFSNLSLIYTECYRAYIFALSILIVRIVIKTSNVWANSKKINIV